MCVCGEDALSQRDAPSSSSSRSSSRSALIPVRPPEVTTSYTSLKTSPFLRTLHRRASLSLLKLLKKKKIQVAKQAQFFFGVLISSICSFQREQSVLSCRRTRGGSITTQSRRSERQRSIFGVMMMMMMMKTAAGGGL